MPDRRVPDEQFRAGASRRRSVGGTAPALRGGASVARAALGQRAEDLACAHLCQLGFEIVARNARVGRLEIDVIARRGMLLVFCEVRSRSNDRLMTPAQSIDARKVARVRSAAAQWLRAAKPGPVQVRFDVASVLFAEPAGKLNYLEGAF